LRTVTLRLAFRLKKANAKLPLRLPRESDSGTVPAARSAGQKDGDENEPFKVSYARAFERALEEAFRELRARERAVLRLHFAEGMNIDAIGRVYGVHRATAARWIASCREELANTTRARLEAQFGELPQDEFDSLFRLVHNELDLSVTSLLCSESFHRLGRSERAPRDESVDE
jgi:RNA polymerase sigma-70 factor (ECF subfamily)